MTLAVPLLGLLAGALTTLAGQGGGLFLLLACSALAGPHAALAVTAPALLLGNAHRALLFRRSIDRRIVLRIVAGGIPGSFVGGLVAGIMPPAALKVALVLLTLLALAKAFLKAMPGVPRGALAPAGFVVGGVTGTAGGAGFLVAPLLLACGLSGTTFVATTSTIAVALHAGRVFAYGLSGVFARDLVLPTVLLTGAIFVGNAVGERVRRLLSDRVTTGLEYGVLVVCVTLSVGGAT